MVRFLILLLVCAVVSCALEESRLQISNPEALFPHLSILVGAPPKSAALVIFTGEKAELSEFTGRAEKHMWCSSIKSLLKFLLKK